MKAYNYTNTFSLIIVLWLPGCSYYVQKNLNTGTSMKKLSTYKKKRSFDATPEPSGATRSKKKSKQPIFVIHKHDASHLHYDVRLEIDGVLTSWAVPKGPPTKIGEKRLAIQTEDHPLEYATFKGIIPEGNYGAGTVEIWDHGTYENIKAKDNKLVSMSDCLENGVIEVYLHGKRLDAPYALIKTSMGGKTQWLMTRMRKRKKA